MTAQADELEVSLRVVRELVAVEEAVEHVQPVLSRLQTLPEIQEEGVMKAEVVVEVVLPLLEESFHAQNVPEEVKEAVAGELPLRPDDDDCLEYHVLEMRPSFAHPWRPRHLSVEVLE